MPLNFTRQNTSPRRPSQIAVGAFSIVAGWVLYPAQTMAAPPATVSGLAEKEVQRRTAKANQSINDINRGYELIQQQRAEEALGLFTGAFEALPDTPLTQEARMAARNGYVVSGCMQAQALQAKAKYQEAADLLEKLLIISPKDSRILALKQSFADPDRWPPALTEKHVENVDAVQKLLIKAQSFLDLGNLDNAVATYQDVLRIDPYNSSARRGMESVEIHKQKYSKSAYDQTRAGMLSKVGQSWEEPVPLSSQDVSAMFGATMTSRSYAESGREAITKKLRDLVFPQVEFAGATLDEVAELLRVRSRDLDPAGKGVSFIINVPAEARGKPISLNLLNVPMEEVLRYVSEMCGVSYKVEEHAVMFVSISERDSAIITRTFRVPPDFIQSAPTTDGASGAAADPFATQAPAGNGLTIRRMSAQEFLEARGVSFPDGASANFNPATSTLIVRNTISNMETVELFVEQAAKAAPKLAVITVRMLEVNQTNLEELGFDWLLGGVGTNGNNLFFGGGSAGSGTPSNAANYPFATNATIPALTLGGNQVIPAQPASAALAGPLPFGVPSPVSGQITGGPATVPYGGGPISSGLRSGTYATGINSLDTLLQTGSATGTASPAPGVLSVAGVFTDPQFQTVMRALSQKKGVDINASPSVTTKNGLKATVDITREFIYPTEFDPPQLPQNGNRTTIVVGATIQQIATPTTPTAFEMRKTGVYMEVEPIISDDGRTVELTISPELTDFEGFVNYGSPITAPSSSSFQPINLTGVGSGGTAFIPANQPEQLITPNLILQPIFKTQKVNTAVKIWDGATVVLGGAKVQQRTMVNDSIPLLGNLPLVGRFFQSNVERVDTKNVVIFVTVDVVDPSGQKINRDTASVTR